MFNRDMLKGLKSTEPTPVIPEGSICVRAWDKAYREPSESYLYPDYTASILMYKDKLCNLYITGDFHPDLHDPIKHGEDKIYGRFRKNVGVRNDWMLRQAEYDGHDCTVVIPKEGGAGAGEFEQLRAMFKDAGFKVEGAETGNKKGGKALRFATFCAEAEQGMVYILPDTFGNKATLNALLTELEKFNPDQDGKWRSTNKLKDDWLDCVSDCTLILQKKRVIKAYSLPDCTYSTKVTQHHSSVK